MCSGKGYAAGIGMTIGSVFGRIAGREAAPMHATERPGGGRPADDRLQFVPLLRRPLRGLSGDGNAPLFTDGDLNYLANLCHGCGACYFDCQFSPPHEFNVNVPKTLAIARAESYDAYAWPRLVLRLVRAQRSGHQR